jgi:hypothetical protein
VKPSWQHPLIDSRHHTRLLVLGQHWTHTTQMTKETVSITPPMLKLPYCTLQEAVTTSVVAASSIISFPRLSHITNEDFMSCLEITMLRFYLTMYLAPALRLIECIFRFARYNLDLACSDDMATTMESARCSHYTTRSRKSVNHNTGRKDWAK